MFLNKIQELMKQNAGIIGKRQSSKEVKKNFRIKKRVLF